MSEASIEVDIAAFMEEISEEVLTDYDELSLGELDLYVEKGPSTTAPQIAGLSFRHHRMAQLVALGYPMTRVADILDCTIATVSRLCKDPTFQILVEAELEKLQSRDHSLQAKLQEVAEVGLDKLHEMLTNDELKLKPDTVRNITTDVLDRSGHGPSKQLQVSKSFGIEASTLERIKENAQPSRRLLPAIEQASAAETPDLQVEVGGTVGESIPETEATRREDGPGSCLPAQIFEIPREESG